MILLVGGVLSGHRRGTGVTAKTLNRFSSEVHKEIGVPLIHEVVPHTGEATKVASVAYL